jgi:hypothetical protein
VGHVLYLVIGLATFVALLALVRALARWEPE